MKSPGFNKMLHRGDQKFLLNSYSPFKKKTAETPVSCKGPKQVSKYMFLFQNLYQLADLLNTKAAQREFLLYTLKTKVCLTTVLCKVHLCFLLKSPVSLSLPEH